MLPHVWPLLTLSLFCLWFTVLEAEDLGFVLAKVLPMVVPMVVPMVLAIYSPGALSPSIMTTTKKRQKSAFFHDSKSLAWSLPSRSRDGIACYAVDRPWSQKNRPSGKPDSWGLFCPCPKCLAAAPSVIHLHPSLASFTCMLHFQTSPPSFTFTICYLLFFHPCLVFTTSPISHHNTLTSSPRFPRLLEPARQYLNHTQLIPPIHYLEDILNNGQCLYQPHFLRSHNQLPTATTDNTSTKSWVRGWFAGCTSWFSHRSCHLPSRLLSTANLSFPFLLLPTLLQPDNNLLLFDLSIIP